MTFEGFSAISWANGWKISMMGLFFVFLGLGLLALFLVLLRRFCEFSEERKQKPAKKIGKTSITPEFAEKPRFSLEGKEKFRKSFDDFALLAEIMPSPISLPLLLDAASGRGIARSNAVLSDLLKAGVLKADGKGFYLWDPVCFENLMAGEKDRNRV